ncbi:MAG TPA: hypothetical protein VHP55_09800 [Usitatibacter sp.]|jgi:hypothetical protein|nr:hypothetical protein [Usitatibacter sp.]
MRKPTPAASLARLVAVLFAAPVIAHALPAAVAVHSSSGTSSSASTSSGTIANAPAGMGLTSTAPAASSSGSSGSTGSSASTTPTNTTTTDQRAAATAQAAQAERASANTAASQLASANAPRGAATVSPTTGASATNSTTTTVSTGGSTTGTTGTTVVGTSLGFPGAIGTIVNSGEPVVDANGNIVSASAAYAVTPPVTEATSFAAPQYVAADVVVADNTMNQVIGETRRDRRRIGRNGQLLYSIAPRTNVDRSREVPDDGPTPALTGPLSR